jgi:ATP/maltotriose-dependent transcriptional regulator MalT
LVAPAGAGKTIGVSGWARAGSATALDEEPVWVQGSAEWDPSRLQAQLTSAAEGLERPRLVIIDDAHLLPARTLRFIDDRLAENPEAMRLLLLSRWDLPLTRLLHELRGHLTVLRGEILRLAEAETAALVVKHAGTDAPEVVDAIVQVTHGWCAEVVLLTRSVMAAPDPVAAARRYPRDGANVGGAIASEVFAALNARERHLLLCVATAEVVTADVAAFLTRDPGAVDVLAHLESTGFLVTRADGASIDGLDATTAETRFRIHPLLVEVVRRRLAAGGVDVERARATVARAAMLEVVRGDVGEAFGHLVAIGHSDLAADVLASHGLTLVTRGHGGAIVRFARDHADVITDRPEAWPCVMLERWVAGNVGATLQWSDRILQAQLSDGADVGRSFGPALAHLFRARVGRSSSHEAVERAKRVAADLSGGTPAGVAEDGAVLPQLLVELGITQHWTGDLAGAEDNLKTGLTLARNEGLSVLAAAAASHLALTEYLLGREHACAEAADEALRMLEQAPSWRPPFTAERASLGLLLAAMTDVPWPTSLPDHASEPENTHPGDLLTRFLMKVCDAKLAAAAGSIVEARNILADPLDGPARLELPRHLALIAHVEAAFLAFLADDARGVAAVAEAIQTEAGTGARTLVTALRAELGGDIRKALYLYTQAQQSTVTQPPVRAIALTCAAQLRDAIGDRAGALDELRLAVTETAPRRNANPFLGWTRHGTRCATLLIHLGAHQYPATRPWLKQLTQTYADRADIATAYTHTISTPAELASLEALPASTISLSPREHDVLVHLARGATYGDIAADLVVSANTVKTHVSSLYNKLGASKRREALAAARRLHLI